MVNFMTTIEKTHIGYIGFILIIIIIVLITVQFSSVPNLSDRLNFGLTITSLVLAILAIAYAVHSNSSLIKNVAIMNEAASEITSSSQNLSTVVDNLTQNTNQIPTRLDSIESLLKNSSNVAEILNEKNEIDNFFDENKTALEANKKRDVLSDADKPDMKNTKEIVDAWRLIVIRRVIRTSSLVGLLLLYACCRAFEMKKTLHVRRAN